MFLTVSLITTLCQINNEHDHKLKIKKKKKGGIGVLFFETGTINFHSRNELNQSIKLSKLEENPQSIIHEQKYA